MAISTLLLGAGLGIFWRAAGFPSGTFVPGLAGHGPDPQLWPRLLFLWVPAGHVLFSVAYVLLARWNPGVSLRGHARADQGALLLVPFLLIGLLWTGPAGPWRGVVGAWYVTLIAVRTGILLHALWRCLAAAPPGLPGAGRAAFATLAVPYVLLVGYVGTTSTSGDEPYYLLIAHSLVHDGDLDPDNNIAAGDYVGFYWGRLAAGAAVNAAGRAVYPRDFSGLQPFLLAPGYAIAGRTGAMVSTALLGAATGALAFLLAREAGASLRAAYLGWLGTSLSVPVAVYTASPFVEAPGAFFLTLAAWLLARERDGVGATAVVVTALTALIALKNRFVLAALPLLAAAARPVTWWRALGFAAAAVFTVAAAVAYDARMLGGHMLQHISGGVYAVLAPHHLRTLAGFLVDQEFGILTTAPVFLLAVAGIGLAIRQARGRLLLVAAGPFALTWLYLAGVYGLSYGGHSPPGRLLAGTLPSLTAFVALSLDRVRSRLGWSAVVMLLAATLGHTLVLAAWPAWRFQDGVGRATLLRDLAQWSGLDVGRLLPSCVAPGSASIVVGLLLVAASLITGWWMTARAPLAPPRGAVASGLALLVLAGVVITTVAWRAPSGEYPVLVWPGRGGVMFHGPVTVDEGGRSAVRERLVLAAQRDAELTVAPRLPAGRYRLTLRVGATGDSAGLSLGMAAGPEAMNVVPVAMAPPPAWRETEHVHEVLWTGGRLPVHIQVRGISRREPVRLAYVDRLRIERLVP